MDMKFPTDIVRHLFGLVHSIVCIGLLHGGIY